MHIPLSKPKTKPKRSLNSESSESGRIPALGQSSSFSSHKPLGAFYSSGPVVSLGAPLQAKITIGKASDPFEREADSAADRVVSGRPVADITPVPPGGPAGIAQPETKVEEEPEKQPAPSQPVQRQAENPQEEERIQTKCAECEAEDYVQAQQAFPPIPDAEKEPSEEAPEEESEPAPTEADKEAEEKQPKGTISEPAIEPMSEEEETPPIQTKRDTSAIGHARNRRGFPPPDQPALQEPLRESKGGGHPLAADVQSEMEQRFGRDLSDVRVHTDDDSVRMNRAIGARAFTHENDIYFGSGEFPPTTQSGKHLLAHELTHTMQQGAVSDTIQRFVAPEQDVVLEPDPERPEDGAEVKGRMNEKIENDSRVQDAEDLDEEERAEAEKPDRGEVRQESSQISSSGESKPSVDRGAEAEQKTESQKAEMESGLDVQPPEAGEEEAEGEEEEAELSPADAAAQRAVAAEQAAHAVPIPPEPEAFRHPRIQEPVDSTGEPLPRNSAIDTQVRGLGYIGEMLRTKGYEMKRHAAQQEMGSYGLDAVLEKQREDLANVQEGTATIEAHTEGRKEIAEKSREAHTESVDRQTFVAEKAPDLAGKAEEGQVDSGALAAEAKSTADQSQSEIPDDDDARADAQEQSGEMQKTAEGTASMDEAITQTAARAHQYERDAAAAAEQNQQSDAQVLETEDLIAQTDARLAEMHATNAASQSKIESAASGPALIRQHAAQTAQSGDELIAATIVMEAELNSLQDEYLSGMSGIESRKAAIERQQKEQQEAGAAKLSPEEQQLFELAGMSDEEQEQRIAEMDQPQKRGLLAALERMIQQAPDRGTDASKGARLKVDTGLSEALKGDQPADPRAEQIQEVENQRILRVGGVLDVADQNMVFLSAAQQQMLANRLVAESITDDIKSINILQMGKDMLIGMIDPRQSLAGVVGGFEKMLSGFANIGNWEAWKKDPLGNLLQIAADITTGLATIFSTILGIAGVIAALMVALTILSWGFLSFMTVPVITWMGTIMTYAGWGAIIAGGLAVYFNYLSYIKNLHDAGTAETARELFGNTEQMKQNASDGFQGAMAVVEGVGAVKMGPKLSSGEFFSHIPKSPGAWAAMMLDNAKSGLKALAGAPAAAFRGAKRLFSGGKQGLVRFKNRIRDLFSRPKRRPAATELETPEARRRQQADLDQARDKPVRDMDGTEIHAEMREVAQNRPKKIEPGTKYSDDYDIEIEANGHTYRRRKDGKGWCRFTYEDCFIDLDPSVRRELGIDDLDVPNEYLDFDPDLEMRENRRLRKEKQGRQAQQEALADIEKTGEKPAPHLREGLEPPGSKDKTGQDVTEAVRTGQKTKPSGEDWTHSPNWEKWADKGGTIREHPDGSVTLTAPDGTSLKYSPDGDPDFTPHLGDPWNIKQTELKGGFSDPPNRSKDFRMANEQVGHPEWDNRSPPGYTWHHARDKKSMQLVPRRIHRLFRHSGGIAEM